MITGRAVIASILGSVVVAATLAAPAASDDTGALTVNASAWATSAPLVSGCAELYFDASAPVATDCVPVGGAFTFDGLDAGDYRVRLTTLGTVGPTQWVGRSDTFAAASAVEVSAGASVEVDYAALPTRSISGTVTDSAGDPVAGIQVKTRWNTSVFEQTTTDAEGNYVLTVDASSWSARTLLFDAPEGLASESWENALLGEGDTLSFSAGQTYFDRNAVIEPGGSITGLIPRPPGFLADNHGCVVAYAWAHSGLQAGRACGTVGTTFTISNLHPGPYALCILDDPAQAECSQYYDPWYGHSYSSGGTDTEPVEVVAGEATSVDIRFGGILKVAATVDTGGPLQSGCLSIPSLASVGAVTDCAPVDGVFTFAVTSDVRGLYGFVLSGASGVENRSYSSDPSMVEIAAGREVHAAITVAAVGTASVALSIARDDGGAITSGCARATLHTASGTLSKGSDCTFASDGVAEFADLPAGDYTFSVSYATGTFGAVWYPGVGSLLEATRVTVADGAASDLAMELPTTQTIAGTVTAPSGAVVSGATVSLRYDSAVVGSTTSGPDGSYQLTTPIVRGTVVADGVPGFGPGWYRNGTVGAALVGGANDPWHVEGVDVQLTEETRVQGTLRVPNGSTWSTVCVVFVNGHTSVAEHACGAPGESFELVGLAPVSHRVCVTLPTATDDCPSGSANAIKLGGGAYYPLVAGDNEFSIEFGGTLRVRLDAGASPPEAGCAALTTVAGAVITSSCAISDGFIELTVADDLAGSSLQLRVTGVRGFLDKTTGVFDIAGGFVRTQAVLLEPWRAISGTITRPTGFADTHACVMATDLLTTFERVCLEPGVSGYSLPMPPGNYWIHFYTEEPGVAFEWHDDKPTLSGAKLVSVTPYGAPKVNATLAASGRVVGVVISADGDPAAGGCVVAVASDGEGVQTDCDLVDGAYELESLPPGAYRLRFVDFPEHAVSWHSSAATFAEATAVTVTAGVTTSVDHRLGRSATIQGTVTYGGGAATAGCVEVVSLDGDTVTSTCEVAEGHYAIDDVPAGSYKVLFTGFDDAADQWSVAQSTFAEATVVTVEAGDIETLDASLSRGGTITGSSVYYQGTADHTVVANLYRLDGTLVMSRPVTPTGNGNTFDYRFDNVPEGEYELAIRVDGRAYQQYLKPRGNLVPTIVLMPFAGSWNRTGLNVLAFGDPDEERGGFYGWLNVPSTWTRPEVCAIAIHTWGSLAGADCGPPGGRFEIVGLPSDYAYNIVFTNGGVRSTHEYVAFTGTKRYLGNTTSVGQAPAYFAEHDELLYLPVWFFKDVTAKTSGFYEISWMGDAGISQGYPDGSFKPNGKVIRQDMARFLYRLAGSPDVDAPEISPFTDVATTNSAYDAIYWLKDQGITTANPFNPKGNVTRKQMVMFLYRMAGEPEVSTPSKSPFKDVKTTDSGYKAIVWAKNEGITTGYSDKTFRPGDPVIRAHMAMFMFRYASLG